MRKALFIALLFASVVLLGADRTDRWPTGDDSGSTAGATQFCEICIELPATTDNVMCGKAYTDYTLVSLTCVATGATVAADLIMSLKECDSGGDNCTTTTNLVTPEMDANDAQVADTTPSGAVIDEDNWYQLQTDSLTTAPSLVCCQTEFTVAE